jgi:hypothetical protein
MQFNKTQQQAITAIYNKYKNVAGSYNATLLGGLADCYLDSGVTSDCFSKADVALITKYCTDLQATSLNVEILNSIVEDLAYSEEGVYKTLDCYNAKQEMLAVHDCVDDVLEFMCEKFNI